jgi:hypothetical protein
VECGGTVIVCDMDILMSCVYLFVMVCVGYAGETLYPIAIPVSTGTI